MNKNTQSLVLVGAQVVLLIYLFLSGPILPTDSIMLFLFIAGVALGAWAVYSFRSTKFSLLPELPENAALVTAGPYRIIRHPMYTSVLLVATALVINSPSAMRLVALIILAGILFLKTEIEERYLDLHFKEYGNYKLHTQKLIPYLY